MVKLKRIDEAQLDLFTWTPKNNLKKDEPEVYDGLSDTDESVWFNNSYVKNKYDEYNRRFFSSLLPNLPVSISGRSLGKSLGVCVSVGNKRENTMIPREIKITNKKFKNRFIMENTLVHEMCHVYQIRILCDAIFSEYARDCKKGSGSRGHGPKFFEAASLVNNSSDNKEGFKITQYNEEVEAITSRPMKNAEGWVFIQPKFIGVSVRMFPNTETGRAALADYGKHNLFTFKDGTVKAKIQDMVGRTQKLIYWKFVKIFCDMIKNGDLIRVSKEPLREVYLYTNIKDGNNIVYSTYTKSNDVELVMNEPYSVLKNLTITPSSIDFSINKPLEKLYKQSIEDGVFSVKGVRKNESFRSFDSIEKEVEDAGNTLSITDISNDEEEIIIE